MTEKIHIVRDPFKYTKNIHYYTLVKSEYLYGTENLMSNRKKNIEGNQKNAEEKYTAIQYDTGKRRLLWREQKNRIV